MSSKSFKFTGKRLGHVHPKIIVNGKHISTLIFRLEILAFQDIPFVLKFFSQVIQTCICHLHSDRNFQNFLVNGSVQSRLRFEYDYRLDNIHEKITQF